MSVPVTPPQFFPPPFASESNGIALWPQVPIENKQSMLESHAEFQPFKKPRTSEDTPSNYFPNMALNPRMPPPNPPVKRARTSEDTPPNSFPNMTLNPMMPPPNPSVNRARNSEDTPSNSFSNMTLNPMMPPPNPPVNRGISKIFFKTRLCAKFKAGTCPYGPNCNFAHGIEDIRKPPPNWQEIVASQGDDRTGNWEHDQRIISRLKLCKKFYNGEECPYGERCNFLHEAPGKFREGSVVSNGREGSVVSNGNTGSSWDHTIGSDQPGGNNGFSNFGVDSNCTNQKPVYWKTKICNKWEMTGHCPFAEKCHFAHGQAELHKFTELQKFGCHNEVETGDVITVPLKPISIPANDASPINTGTTGASCKQQVVCKRNLLKWKKINRIYADWIDDIPLVRSSLSNVEN